MHDSSLGWQIIVVSVMRAAAGLISDGRKDSRHERQRIRDSADDAWRRDRRASAGLDGPNFAD
jgi:hypothetical protein